MRDDASADLQFDIELLSGEAWQAAHFPSRPLVPGVVLLQNLQFGCRQVDAMLGALLELRHVRFIGPVVAPARLHIAARRSGAWLHCTAVRAAGEVVLRAQLRFATRSAAPRSDTNSSAGES